ncbi:hypothetical protein OsJ_19184 [Oryza sativa Japonica Group]|uniref:Secreted protein n=1 Tax=Oryza sativa subsp. japonica TaxID=39947 RepID=B9FL41_ORYSJ|nr:hypothetical protein OsJ_19184 [Oryza sativa Japonica Group]
MVVVLAFFSTGFSLCLSTRTSLPSSSPSRGCSAKADTIAADVVVEPTAADVARARRRRCRPSRLPPPSPSPPQPLIDAIKEAGSDHVRR